MGVCGLAGIAHVTEADIVVFLDGDYSDDPKQMSSLVQPIKDSLAEFVIGTRIPCEKGALLPQAKFGNKLATLLMGFFFGAKYTDLGTFRAILYTKLLALEMQDKNFGWTIEMQLKAVKAGMNVKEVPVTYRKRIGTSKISGTFIDSIKAGVKIITTLFKHTMLR